nr:MAG TPA: hypothetical protein [Caudoviricetes sp.]
MGDKWNPQKGDHVYHVQEFHGDGWDKRLDGYERFGYEVVESVVKGPYEWRYRRYHGVTGCVSTSKTRLIGSNANNVFYWRPGEYGRKLFQNREAAEAVAEKLTSDYEAKWKFIGIKPLYRHWKEVSENV